MGLWRSCVRIRIASSEAARFTPGCSDPVVRGCGGGGTPRCGEHFPIWLHSRTSPIRGMSLGGSWWSPQPPPSRHLATQPTIMAMAQVGMLRMLMLKKTLASPTFCTPAQSLPLPPASKLSSTLHGCKSHFLYVRFILQIGAVNVHIVPRC